MFNPLRFRPFFLLLLLGASHAGAVSNIRNVSWSPANPVPGDVVAVTWTYDQPPGNQANAAIIFAPTCAINASGSAGQTTLLGDGCTQPAAPGNLSGGCLTNGGGLTYTAKTVTKNITIPAGLVLGQTYQVIIAMRNGVFMNPNMDTSGDYSSLCTPYTYLLPGAKIQVSKSVNKVGVQAGANLTYILVATNVGASTAANVVVQDTLPAGINPVPVSESFSTAPSATTAGPPRRWTFPSLASGASLTITLTVQTQAGQPLGTTLYNNFASAYSTTDPVPLSPSGQAISFSVNQPAGCWVSYALWDTDPAVVPLTTGTTDGNGWTQGNLHIYSLIDSTTATLSQATNLDSELDPMPINAVEAGFPLTLNAGRNTAFGSFKSKFHKLATNYPVIWEYDSDQVDDRLGRSMVCYSTDYKYADNKPFFTYLDYNRRSSACGTPSCAASHTGDALHVFNPSLVLPATFAVYNSPNGTGGAAWSLVGNYSVGPEGIVLIGGATQSGTIPYGDYMVVSTGSDASTPGLPIIVAKGNANCQANGYGHLTDGGCLYGVAPSGQRVADGSAGNDRLYGLLPPSGRIIVTGISGVPQATVYRYTATSGPTIEGAINPEWPISGSTGSWAVVAGPTAVATGFPAAPYIYNGAGAGYYKVVVSGGAVTAAFAGRSFEWDRGDGDFVPSYDHRAALGVQSPNIMFGKDFWFSSGPGTKGGIGIIMPTILTQVTISNNSYTTGNSPFLGQNSSYGPALASPTDDSAWRYLFGQANQNYHVTSNKDVFVVVQNEDHDKANKAFAAPPQVILPPKFSLVKSADSAACYSLGDTVTYCVAYSNLGCDSSNFQIWDTVPSALLYQGATAPGFVSGGIVQWTIPFVPAGGSGSVCFWGVLQSYSALPEFNGYLRDLALRPEDMPMLARLP
jgi:uncharacterized repeat protein (TIGR01451 family)